MANIPLVPVPIDPGDPIFDALTRWPFEDEFVSRILRDDIPQRAKYQDGRVWIYTDPASEIVGFGTLSVCADYAALTDGKPHAYIPLLAVHPDKRGLGHGRSIVEHLVGEAAYIVQADPETLHHAVFLDVYEESVAAFGLYLKCGFQALGNRLWVDDLNAKRYRVMAKRVTHLPP